MAEHQKKTFTADKLNWLDCVANDRDLKPAAFKVAYAIMQHVNAETLIAWLSDETLVDITGISRPQVQRHRESLKEAGWLTWERTQIANHYTPLFDRVKAGLDDILARREKRKELRKTRRTTQVNSPGASPATQPDASLATQPDASPAMHIHLRDNTYEITPSKDSNPERSASGSSGNVKPVPGYRQTKAEADRAFDRLKQVGGPWRQAGDGDPEFDPSPRADHGASVRWHRLLKRGYAANRIVQSAGLYFANLQDDPVQTLARWLASEEFTDPESNSFVPAEQGERQR
jgi:Helix-turn-helix domain